MGKKLYTVKNVLTKKFRLMAVPKCWVASIGEPELTGSWIIYGPPKNGKTSFAMMLTKMLTLFGKVLYDSVEEGVSLSMCKAIERAGIMNVSNNWGLADKEDVDTLISRLRKQRSADIIVIDSIQFMELKFTEYKRLKEMFPNKLFIYISHVEGSQPEGNTARRIWRDANISFRIEGFKAFPVGRYGGGAPIVINEERASAYWGD